MTYSLITDRNYELAEAVLRFGTTTLKKHHNDKVRRMMAVNLANAIRLQKRQDEATAILRKEDWSAAGPEFAVCVAAVTGDVDEVARLVVTMGKDGPISIGDYRNWPVFRGLRTNDKFATAFERVFGSKLLSPKKAVMQSIEEPSEAGAGPIGDSENGSAIH